ncbi:hypothetical protein SAMN02799624_03907 [Paenibacillus sp. UNC496MF]|uniref:hypothetical protein n=1 Tax=Paenibacillus sp. UNC496MF TaxID=1502753 RepID=UPI0008F23C60|nr:hypothetical protein [Paenibacillus sp. UNC496MF]SFJ26497.1 hypothetical protein SAMN02799624_03907 [Paenibacillus sp. UNC496MF]
MAHKWVKVGVVALASSALLFQNADFSVTPVAAAASSSTSSISSKIVKLSASAYLNIRDVHFLMQSQGKVLVYSVSITNNGNSSLDLMDYWLRVKTKSGKTFKTTAIDSDKDIKDIPAKSTQYLTYYTVVDSQTKLTDLSFQVLKWDFSVANYERTLGTIQYPANGTDKVTPFKDATMLYDHNKVRGAIKQSYITTDATNAYLVVNLLVENVGFQSSDLSKMNFFVQTNSLSVYNVTASGLDQATIQPKERKIVTLHATIPLAVASKALSLVVAQNDEASKVQLPVGVFALPATKPLSAAPAGKTRMVYMSGSPTNTVAGQAFVSQGTSSKDISLEFRMTNIGTASIANPALDYFIVTASGTSYPLSYEKEENAVLLPNIEKTISLTGQVPTNVNLTNAKLVVKSQATDKEKPYIIGTYALQTATQQGSLGGSFTYNDFSVKLNSVQRAPSSDNDVLVATLSVTNRSKATVQIPSLGGYFMVNGVKIGTEQKAVAMDDSVTIAPGASADFVVYSEIPYTTSIDKITFVSTEPVQDKPGKQLYQFSAQQLSDIPYKKIEEAYAINSIGKRSTVNVLRTAIFNGTTKNNFYAEFEAVNKELRSAAIAPLGGYIVDQKGIVVPVQFATVKDKLSPNGKALLSAFATIPKSFDTTSYKLILGQTLLTAAGGEAQNSGSGGTAGGTGGSGSDTGTDGGTTNPVLVNMVSYPMSASEPVTKSDLGDIQFAGYTLGLHYINAFLSVAGLYDVNGLKMTLDYSLAKNGDYEVISGDHKLLIEFVNQDNNHVTYSQQFGLETAGENEQALTVSEDNPLTISFSDTEIQSKILHYDTYKVNVYDVFQNSKLLLASKEMNWFTTTP